MATEIERKFLIKGEAWRAQSPGTQYCQGYIATASDTTVRVRIAGDRGYLTIKGKPTSISRQEFEYAIPLRDAREMLDTLCDRPLISKTRYRIDFGGLTWEIDEFEGENQGLIIAEVELGDLDQTIDLPDWVGQEVSEDRRYSNTNLVKNPFGQWTENSHC